MINKDRDITNRYNAAMAERKEAQGKVQELKKLLEGYDVEEDTWHKRISPLR